MIPKLCILEVGRELAVKLVTLRRCKYYKWECVWKVERREWGISLTDVSTPTKDSHPKR